MTWILTSYEGLDIFFYHVSMNSDYIEQLL